jgi:hypothetical protein
MMETLFPLFADGTNGDNRADFGLMEMSER